MQELSNEFKQNVVERLRQEIKSRHGYDAEFLRCYGLKGQTCLKAKIGQIDRDVTDQHWLRLSHKLKIGKEEKKWNLARTDVFNTIEEDVLFCKQHAKAKICVDECGIGKTFTGKYLASTLPNCFYVDASQGKTISLFTKILAEGIGLNGFGKYIDIKEDIKCYLKMIDKPIVIIDEAGDLGQVALQEIKEFWNATEGYCGWYLMGADGLKYVINQGIKAKKPGFKEIFSRFSEKYTTTVPKGKDERLGFYKKLITDVLTVNMPDEAEIGIKEIVARCLVTDEYGSVSGLRRAESLLLLHSNNQPVL